MSNEMNWIRLEERLPDEDGWYLVTTILKRKPLIIAVTVEYWGYGWDCDYDEEDDCVRGFLDDDHNVMDLDNFVAWMPLPEPCYIATSKEDEQ